MKQPPLDSEEVLGMPRDRMPRHIAIIMDGNGRWAKQRGWPRVRGHEQGATVVRDVVTQCARLGIDALTLYCFSSENWSRPPDEIECLMGLYVRYLISERETIVDNEVRFRHVGQRDGLPDSVLTLMDEITALSQDASGLTLCLALNYGSRGEIVDAVRTLARKVKAGILSPDDIDATLVSQSLQTQGLPDPDLLIRTAGERRISNFLLWQISYAELYISEKFWPDFGVADLNLAIQDFAGRERRFGAVPTPVDQSA